jgi:hypothetical protein
MRSKRTFVLFAVLVVLIAISAYAYWLGVFGRYERLGKIALASRMHHVPSEAEAQSIAARINALDWNDAVSRELANQGATEVQGAIGCEIHAIASETRLMINASYTPWQLRKYSLTEWTTTWDEDDPECQRRNALVEKAILELCTREMKQTPPIPDP